MWQKIEDRFPIGASNSYPLGSTGGEDNHTLTVNEMPRHTHRGGGKYTSNGINISWGGGFSVGDVDTEATGGGQPHNNLPPYKAYNMWQRIA